MSADSNAFLIPLHSQIHNINTPRFTANEAPPNSECRRAADIYFKEIPMLPFTLLTLIHIEPSPERYCHFTTRQLELIAFALRRWRY